MRLLALLACCAAAAWAPARAQTHEITRHGFTLRSSTVASTTFDSATAHRHGIEPSPTRGVLNVVVLRRQGRSRQPVPAEIRASARNLAGMKRGIEMREVRQDGYVSYVGSYDFAPREVLDFHIEARPRGSRARISLTYRERLWATQ